MATVEIVGALNLATMETVQITGVSIQSSWSPLQSMGHSIYRGARSGHLGIDPDMVELALTARALDLAMVELLPTARALDLAEIHYRGRSIRPRSTARGAQSSRGRSSCQGATCCLVQPTGMMVNLSRDFSPPFPLFLPPFFSLLSLMDLPDTPRDHGPGPTLPGQGLWWHHPST